MSKEKQKVRLGFVDFWKGYQPENEYIYKALQDDFDITIDNENPDFLFCSCLGHEHLKYNEVVKIFITGENVFPNFNLFDYAVSSMRSSVGGRNLFFPGATRFEPVDLPPTGDSLVSRRFCCFIYSQETTGEGAHLRKRFCQELMKYQKVDCPGRVLHNMEALELANRTASEWRKSKINFLKKYKFCIAFENSDSDGYMTEKLIDPLLAGSIPIYWGSTDDISPFPKECMICAHDYPDFDSLIARVREVNENDELYLSMCRANPLRTGEITSYKQRFISFFDSIYTKGNVPIKKDPLHLDTARILYREAQMSFLKKLKNWIKNQTSRLPLRG